jgi:hypothetical protein
MRVVFHVVSAVGEPYTSVQAAAFLMSSKLSSVAVSNVIPDCFTGRQTMQMLTLFWVAPYRPMTGHSGRASMKCLRPLEHWDRGIESR